MRVGVLGVSIDDPCGVRDHAALLADALGAEGVSCSLHWLSRGGGGSLGDARREVGAWAAASVRECRQEGVDAVLLHYSVFAFSYRGLPVLLWPVLAALRGEGLPLVSFMHELAYPWQMNGLRGKVWASSQRLALRSLVRDSAGIVVSADARADWLRTRAWLQSRSTAVAPVFPNLPMATLGQVPARGRLGLFGYAHEGVAVDIVLDALAEAREHHGEHEHEHEHEHELELMLLGAPGRSSSAGERWRRTAAERGLADALLFSERLPAQQLADALQSCELLLFAERGGPTSRKTTLAASLASARPLIALDGPNSWGELLAAGAATVVPAQAGALADAIVALHVDEQARISQGARGRAFAAQKMSVEHSASVVAGALRQALAGAGA